MRENACSSPSISTRSTPRGSRRGLSILNTHPSPGPGDGRRLMGEDVITEMDMHTGRVLSQKTPLPWRPIWSTIYPPRIRFAAFPTAASYPALSRACWSRAAPFSSEDRVNEMLNLMGHCIALGQAAGTAAALAVKHDSSLRDVDIPSLQNSLREQGVPLPDMEKR